MYKGLGRGPRACIQLMKEAAECGEFWDRRDSTWRMHGGRRE